MSSGVNGGVSGVPRPAPAVTFTVAGLPAPARLDRVLRQQFPAWGRQAVGRLIAGRGVQVNGRDVWLASWQVQNGDHVRVAQPPPPKPPPLDRWDPAWLLAADAHLVVVNKPAGLLSEAPPRRAAPNLHALAAAHFGPLVLLHRLDRDTSGVLVLARTPEATSRLGAAWQAGEVQKEYLAVVSTPNQLEAAGRISARLAPDGGRRGRTVVVPKGGQGAVTRYAVVAQDAARQLVRLWPLTGRTHQLRVHLALLGAPILGDRLYGPAAADAPAAAGEGVSRLLLHAWRLTLPDPAGDGAGTLTFTAPLPPAFGFAEVEL